MSDRIRITIAQANPVMGDLEGNAEKALAAWREGKAAGADLVALPEMFITGYNAQDLILKPAFHQAAMAKIEEIAGLCADGPALALGGPFVEDGRLYNAYHVCRNGKVTHRQLKHHLPNYTVFDEERLFAHGPLGGRRL